MATYVDMAGTINRIRALLPNIGNIYYVDTDAGVDAASRGTYALPLKTIDYAISNYVTAYRGDVVICWGSAGGDFDENVNVDGVQVDKANTAIIGINMPKVDNSNGGATSIFHVTVQSCRIWGFACVPTVPIIGIHCDSLFAQIGGPEFGMGFEDCSVDVQLDGNQNICEGNRHTNSSIGYLCNQSGQEIRNNLMLGSGVGGSIGVSITLTTPSVQNYIHDNDITGYETGIKAALAAIQNTGCRNALNSTTTNISDANAVGLNNWEGNYITGAGVDLEPVIKRLQEMGVTGNIFFADTAGNDANPGTYALPCLTIDHTVGLCTAYHNDAVVVTDSLFNNYDENVNVDGVQLDVAGMTLVGIGNDILVTNSNVAAVSVFHITADQVNIYGVNGYGGTFPSLHTEDGDWCMIGKEGWKTTFRGATGGTGIFHEEGSNCKYQYIDIDGVSTGIQVQDMYNEIHHCNIQGDNAGGSLGITLDTPGASNWNYIHDNAISNFALGLDAAINTLNNIFADNAILCFLATSDGNAANVNGWINNKTPGEISRGGLLQSDLASINSRGFPEAGQNVSGTYRFVSTGGSDVSGNGTWTRPYATITYAMGLSSDGDTIICVDPTFAVFDENIGITGLVISSGVTVIGIGMPWLTNSNVGATSVVDFQDNGRITGFVIRATVAGCAGVVMNANNSRVDHCELQDGGAAGIGIQIIVAPVEVDNNFINAWTVGIEDGPGTEDKIHDNTINNCATAISLIGVGAGAMIRHNWLYQTTPGATIAFNVAVTCGVHNITDNYVHGYPANSFLAPVNFVSNHIESQIATNNTLEEDLGDIYGAITGAGGDVSKLQAMGVLGNVYFVDCDAGVDAVARGTYLLPLKTIDYCINNYVTDNHNDWVVCAASAGGSFDEDANADGVEVDKNFVTIIGVNKQFIENTNVAATAVMTVSGYNCRIYGFWFDGSPGIIGIDSQGSDAVFGNEAWPLFFGGCSIGINEQGYSDVISNCITDDATPIGISIHEDFNEVKNCNFGGNLGVGSIGIEITGGGNPKNSYIHNCKISNFETGVSISAGCTLNVIAECQLLGNTTNLLDASTPGVNGFINNEMDSQIAYTHTMQQDLAETDRQPVDFGRTGRIFYVKKTGLDTNPGTFDQPFLTIDAAVNACVSARNDTVVIISNGFNWWDENVNADGVELDIVGVTLVGIQNPQILNSNMAATAVITITGRRCRLYNLTAQLAVGTDVISVQNEHVVIQNVEVNAAAGVNGINCTTGQTTILGGYITAADVGIIDAGNSEIGNLRISNGVVGIRLSGSYTKVHDVSIDVTTTGVDIIALATGNSVVDCEISNAVTPIATLAAGTFLRNNIDRRVFAHTITAAHATAETTAAEITCWTSGKLSVICDMTDLIAHELGKMATFRLKVYVTDANYYTVDQKTFIIGSDTVYPTLSNPAGMNWSTNIHAYVTVEMSAAVGGNRDLNLRQLMED